jgi:hypothetical protein
MLSTAPCQTTPVDSGRTDSRSATNPDSAGAERDTDPTAWAAHIVADALEKLVAGWHAHDVAAVMQRRLDQHRAQS